MTRFVPGEGPQPCRYMLVGEGPGAEEEKSGRPFVGKSGRELWRYLWRACGLTRDDVWTTNLVKYRVPDDGDPTPEDIARDAPLLEEEIANVKPEVIVTLGRWSSRHFLGELDMDWAHGTPQMVGSTVVVPIVHPAAGLHSTEFQGTIAWDFEQLGRLLRGEIEPRILVDGYPDPEYFERDGFTMVGGEVAVDTEGDARKPWCLSFTGTPGAAVCNRIGGVDFQHIILHNALHDIGVLRSMNVSYDRFDDTMIQAYLLCVEPQGLKALAKRHCGMQMQDYSDIIYEANREKAIDYINRALQVVRAKALPKVQGKDKRAGKSEAQKETAKGAKNVRRKVRMLQGAPIRVSNVQPQEGRGKKASPGRRK